jgi:hypothetical protein
MQTAFGGPNRITTTLYHFSLVWGRRTDIGTRFLCKEVKVKVPRNRTEGPERDRGIALLFLDLGTRRGGWSAPRPSRFTPGKELVPIVQKAGRAPGPFWTGEENLAPTGIRSPDSPARSQSLYRLSYPGPQDFYLEVSKFLSKADSRYCNEHDTVGSVGHAVHRRTL